MVNIGLCSLEIIGIHSSAISQKMRKICLQKLSSAINFLKIFMHLVGDNELMKSHLFVAATVFNNANQHINVYGEDIEVDYRGYEVCCCRILYLF